MDYDRKYIKYRMFPDISFCLKLFAFKSYLLHSCCSHFVCICVCLCFGLFVRQCVCLLVFVFVSLSGFLYVAVLWTVCPGLIPVGEGGNPDIGI